MFYFRVHHDWKMGNNASDQAVQLSLKLIGCNGRTLLRPLVNSHVAAVLLKPRLEYLFFTRLPVWCDVIHLMEVKLQILFMR